MKVKIIKWLLILGIASGVSATAYTLINFPIVQKQELKYLIKLTGAIYFPGEYFVLENSLLLDLLQNAQIKENADLSKLDLNKKITKNETINIEFTKENTNNTKLILNNINDIKELLKLKLSKVIINKIWDYKNNNTFYSWEEIGKLKGIGEKILIYLKNHIIL